MASARFVPRSIEEWERLQEALLHLEHARREEQQLRRLNDAMLEGLGALAAADTPQKALEVLRRALERITRCEDCWILWERNGRLQDDAGKRCFEVQRALARVLAGELLNAFDVRLIPEWQQSAADEGVRSALHLPLRMAPDVRGMLVLVSSQPAAFSPQVARAARRVIPFCEQVVARIASLEERQARRLRAVLDRLPAGIWLSDAQGDVLFVNRTARQWFGEHPAMPAQSGKHAVVCRDGVERIFEYACVDADDGERVHMAIDVSERERHLRERAEMQKRLLQVQRMESLGVLAGGIAHDFNNLLAAIMGHADLAREMLHLHPLDAREHLSCIIEASERAADLCRQLLAYAGKGKFVIERVDLSQVVKGMMRVLKVGLHENVQLRTLLAPELPPIEADASQMQQVVMNLITNANEAIGERAGEIAVSTGVVKLDAAALDRCVRADDARPGWFVFVEVADTGCGMDAKTMERIFEPFFTTKFTGRGLGMSAIYGIVRSHRGAIEIESTPGKGTRVRVMFPALEAPKQEAIQQPQPLVSGKEAVLVVDDEPELRRMLAKMLHQLGVQEVLFAADGIEAEEVFRREHDRLLLVVLDFRMPHRDGLETLRVLRAIDAQVPIVLSSGYGEEDLAQKSGDGLQAFAFLAKPYRLAQLRRLLEEAQNRTQAVH